MTTMTIIQWTEFPPEVRRILWQIFLLIVMAICAWIMLKDD
jgi:hypothetical protein